MCNACTLIAAKFVLDGLCFRLTIIDSPVENRRLASLRLKVIARGRTGMKALAVLAQFLGRAASSIGVLGVVGSLVFVGMELRQSKTIAIAATLQERTNTAVAGFYEFSAAGLDWHSFMLEQKFENDFSRDLIARRNTYHLSWFLFENDFAQHKLGLLDEEVWKAKKRAFRSFYNYCDLRPLYEARKSWMPDDFTALIATMPDQC